MYVCMSCLQVVELGHEETVYLGSTLGIVFNCFVKHYMVLSSFNLRARSTLIDIGAILCLLSGSVLWYFKVL